ncbi:MAG TPA: AMP-binding protein [Vicinamibacterales bacterium]|nr:AMP-binding protein [Vicinamibacterales bacterium]
MARDTLIDVFHDFSRARGDFLVYDDGFRSRSYSYEETIQRAKHFAVRLDDLGLSHGDAVVFWSENRPEWIAAFWGCLLRGVVVVPIDYRSSQDFLQRVSRIVSAKLVLVGQEVSPPGESPGAPVLKLHELEWPDSAPRALAPIDINRDTIAEIIFTSGATADPKGVVITHRNILANIIPVEQEVLKYRKWGTPFYPIRFLNLLPLSHMFGQAMATFVPPMLGGVVVFMRGYNPVDIVAQVKKRRISVVVSVPKILDVLREHVLRTAPEANTPSPRRHWLWRWWHFRRIHRMFGWKFWAFVVGAAPLDPSLETFWGELGFVVVQGYGLTETAPIVSLNHPFGTRRGSVGKAMAGVDVKIAADGEILVRGENVTTGYFNAPDDTAKAFEDGWFHTGDIGEVGPDGEIFIRGRKKEMIVTPEGLNVFPEDVERVLNDIPGVHDSAVVGVPTGSEERVNAVLVLAPGTDVDRVVRAANAKLDDHQRIRRAHVWPEGELPRTEGTRKLKRSAIRAWVIGGGTAIVSAPADPLAALIAKYSGRGDLSSTTTIEELGLSSLERVELMVAVEDAFHTHLDEGAFAGARDLGQLRQVVERAEASEAAPPEPVNFPAWNRSRLARAIRNVSLATWLLPLGRVFAWLHVEGRERLDAVRGPVIFAANHQSHMDTPVILTALPPRWRYRTATAMAKEFFKAHFFPAQYSRAEWFTNSLNYYLAALFFNAFPLPQREAGARQTLQYIGDLLANDWSVLIFPEGERTDRGEINRFMPGVGMIASRLSVPVVPVRIVGLDKVLHRSWRMARPGRVRVSFGAPLHLVGDDYTGLAKQVEEAVRSLD